MRLENDHVTVTMLPEHGGKIVEIINRQSGRNWLWSNAAVPHRLALGAGDYDTRLDSGGWDEILLSIEPCTVLLPDGTSIDAPDHGDLVGRAWQQGDAGVDDDGNAFCVLTATGRAAPYAWSRKLVLERSRPRLRVEYHLENTGASDLPFFWCAHPLVAMERGMRILLPAALPCRLAGTRGVPAANSDVTMRWPHMPAGDGRLIDLSRCLDPPETESGFTAKVFLRAAESPRVTIERADRSERLILDYDPDTTPWLGLWINDRGWAGAGGRPYLNVGLEPSTAACDGLSQAVTRGEVPILRPGERRRWQLHVSLQGETAAPVAAAGALQ